MSVDRRRQIIEVNHPQLSLVRQCEPVSIARLSYYYRPKSARVQSRADAAD